MTPLVSVIIPTFQHAGTLPGCLDALFKQTYERLEVIVVDDGSTDNTAAVLRPYESRLKIIRQENSGANPARNRGRHEANGELLLFCDADVILRPCAIADFVSALESDHTASYAYSGFWFGWKRFTGLPFSADRLRRLNYIHTTSLVRASDFPGFDEQIKRLQDWDVWLTMLAQGKHGVLVPKTLFSVKIHGASRIGSSWLPAFVYRLPWGMLGFKPRRVQKYEEARSAIVKKHHLPV